MKKLKQKIKNHEIKIDPNTRIQKIFNRTELNKSRQSKDISELSCSERTFERMKITKIVDEDIINNAIKAEENLLLLQQIENEAIELGPSIEAMFNEIDKEFEELMEQEEGGKE